MAKSRALGAIKRNSEHVNGCRQLCYVHCNIISLQNGLAIKSLGGKAMQCAHRNTAVNHRASAGIAWLNDIILSTNKGFKKNN